MADNESQVMEVVACDRQTAKRLLQNNNNDVQAAVMAFLDPGAGQQPENQSIVPYAQPEPPARSGWTPPPQGRPIGPLSQPESAFEDSTQLEQGTKHSERTSKKRNTPVDLTGDDDDEDLRKAMQESLESESTRQKRQQEYGFATRSVSSCSSISMASGSSEASDQCEEAKEHGENLDRETQAKAKWSLRGNVARVYRRRKANQSRRIITQLDEDDDNTEEKHSEIRTFGDATGSPRQECHAGYTLRNRRLISKPYDKLIAITASLPQPKTRKVAKRKQHSAVDSWWQTSNADVYCVLTVHTKRDGLSTDMGNDDDEALSRAIEASMQQSTSATRAQTPQNFAYEIQSMETQAIRPPGQPVAIVSTAPFMKLFACSLQILFSSAPFRKALLSLRFLDVRLSSSQVDGSSMEDYWQGGSPNSLKDVSEEMLSAMGVKGSEEERAAVEATMRMITLFVFLTFTKRPLCAADDVINRPLKSNYAYVMNSTRRPASDIVSCNVQAIMEMVHQAIECLDRGKPGISDECQGNLSSSYLSYTAMAVTPQTEEPKAYRRSKESFDVGVLQLIHNNVNTSVHRAIYAYLADDKSLFTSTSKSLFLSVGRLGKNTLPFGHGMGNEASEELPPFQVESVLYMDQFMFDRRNGVRLGLDTDSIKEHQHRVEELEKHRKAHGWYQGTETVELLRSSLRYFEELCDTKGADQMRLESINEAVPRLRGILATLEAELAETDALITEAKRAIEEERNVIMSSFTNGLEDPQLQTICYDLQAVLMNDGENSWCYVRHDGTMADPSSAATSPLSSAASSPSWWKVSDGLSTQVTEGDVFGDSNTVHFLIYTRRMDQDALVDPDAGDGASERQEDFDLQGKPSKTIRLDTEIDYWAKSSLVDCIELDNAAFGNQLAQRAAQEHAAAADDSATSMLGAEAVR